MLYLGNDELRLAVLDPLAEEDRLGTRYVSGGYIYQVEDTRLGPLVSGPAYPDERPPVFDGQGLPEAFRDSLDGLDGQCLRIGNAIVEASGEGSRGATVIERCHWRIEPQEARLGMSTTQRFADWEFHLYRDVALDGRQVISSTRIENCGAAALPLRWFAHPFFPWPADGVCCRFGVPVRVPDNPGFRVNEDGFIARLPQHDWQKGQFVQIEGATGHRLQAEQRHPALETVSVRGDFEVAQMPIWGNACTVSFEPYLRHEVASGQDLFWSLTYEF